MARPDDIDEGRQIVDPRYRAWLRARQGARRTIAGEQPEVPRKVSKRVLAVLKKYRAHNVPAPAPKMPPQIVDRLRYLRLSIASHATPTDLADEIDDLLWLIQPRSDKRSSGKTDK